MSNAPCEYLIDVYGLRAVCDLPAARKTKICEMIASGKIRMLAGTWTDFENMFDERAADIAQAVGTSIQKISNRLAVRECAATLIEQADMGFTPKCYDSCSDLYTASACHLDGFILLTGTDNLAFYNKLNACAVQNIETVQFN